MRCPRCAEKTPAANALLRSVDTDNGPTLDFCAACGGVWFDKGEAKEHISRSLILEGKKAPSNLDCPRCAEKAPGARLEELTLTVPGAPVLDLCPSCEGVWFDQGEVARLKLMMGVNKRSSMTFTAVPGAPAAPTGQAPIIVPILALKKPKSGIDWAWVIYGFVVLMALLGASSLFVNTWIASDAFLEDADPTPPTLLIALCSVTAFALGGFLVGWKSRGFTLWEPAMVAIPAAACFPVLFGSQFTSGQLAGAMVGGVVVTLLGAAFGERFQAA